MENLETDLVSRPRPTARRLEITPARRSDMPVIADMVRSSADWYRPFLDPKDMAEHEVDEEWQEKNFARRDFYVGRLRDEPIGTISIQYLGDYAYLGYIYLDVAHVGHGHGGRLMGFAEKIIRESNARGMSLIAHPKATWAKKAYLKYGFEIVAKNKQEVLAWQGGVLDEYYEEGFELYIYDFARQAAKERC